MPEVGRPSQKQQSSRKGKKAWRKNIDIDDVEDALDAKREEIRTLGVEVDQISSEQLFQIDISGDNELIKKKKLHGALKKLKADEILANKSKVPGLTHVKHSKSNKNKKFQGVSGKEAHSLMKIAGRVQGVTTSQGLLEKHGFASTTNTINYDVWDEAMPESKKVQSKKVVVEEPELLNEKSVTSYTQASVAPKTLREKPISVKEVEAIPHAGKSYNPSLPSWKDLINQEFFKEKSEDDKRIALKQYQDRIQQLIATIDDEEEKSDSEDEEEKKGEKSKNHNDSSDEEGSDDEELRLSVNKPVKNKKKTRTQRNRQKRHEEKLKLEKELKELKKQITELQRIKDIEQEVSTKIETLSASVTEPKKRKNHKLGTKYHVMNDALEVKLSDELNDSLRKLTPEGNLLYDQMRNLQSKGKVESRLPVKKKRRYTPKVTEKWSYKDFK